MRLPGTERSLFELGLELSAIGGDRSASLAEPREAVPDPQRFDSAWGEYLDRLSSLPPVASPGFAAQMTSPPHPVALLGYFAAMLRNPNNHDARYAAATLAMERESVAALADMFGFAGRANGHLTSGGTLANLDGVQACHVRHPASAVAFSEDAHFAHARICKLMGVTTRTIGCDALGRMDLDRLESAARRGRIGTVVATAGTPGFGAVDPIDGIVALSRRYGFAVHVDASYGGFFTLLRDEVPTLAPATARALAAIAECDSVAVDPHKHGYQPYGCGCVIFRDGAPASSELSSPYVQAAARSGLECSRSGAAAGALWLTLRCLPLHAGEGFGNILRECRQGAREFAGQLEAAGYRLARGQPQLGVVGFLPDGGDTSPEATRRIAAAAEAEGVFLSLLRVSSAKAGSRKRATDSELLRAVFMRGEQRQAVPDMIKTLSRLRQETPTVKPEPPAR